MPATQTMVRATGELTAAELNRQLAAFGVSPDYAREHRLRRVRQPQWLVCVGEDVFGRERHLAAPAARAWQRMRAAAERDGIPLQLVSAWRSVIYQCGIIERKLARGQNIGEILASNAAPGYSEHHSGRAVDLTTPGYEPLEEDFEHSPAFAWLTANAARHGFRMSYPRGNLHGVVYEPWHWCWHRVR